MKPNRSVEFCVPLCKQHEHSQQLQHNFMSVRLFWQISNIGFEIASSLLQCLALTVSGNWAGWFSVQSVAKCKLQSCRLQNKLQDCTNYNVCQNKLQGCTIYSVCQNKLQGCTTFGVCQNKLRACTTFGACQNKLQCMSDQITGLYNIRCMSEQIIGLYNIR